MSKVLVTKEKLDRLASIIAGKAGEKVKLTIDGMTGAAESIKVDPTLQTVLKTYTPSSSQQTDIITPSSGYDGIGEVDVTVNTPPTATTIMSFTSSFITVGGQKVWETTPFIQNVLDEEGYLHFGGNEMIYGQYIDYDVIPSGTSVTPTESQQTIGGSNHMMEGAVTVNAIPSNYVGSGITQRSSLDLTANGATVTAPAGYYPSAATKTISSGSATPASSISATGATVSTGTNTLTLSKSVSNTPQVSAGYISSGTAGNSSVSLTASVNTRSSSDLTASGATVTVPAGYYSSAATKTVDSVVQKLNVDFNPTTKNWSFNIDSGVLTATLEANGTLSDFITKSGYIDSTAFFYAFLTASGTYSLPTQTLPTSTSASATSGYTSKATISRSTSDQYINIPAGYNSSGAYYKINAVANGTEGTPTASKGSVSNHAIAVTPSVTNTAGYISGGTKTGTAVSVAASELVSGNLAISQNGTGIDVTNYATVSVSVSGGGGGSGVSVDTVLNSAATTSTLTFTNLKGEPTSFAVMLDSYITPSATAQIAAVVYDGTSVHAQTITNTSNAQVSYASTGVTYSYSSGTLVITSTSAQFIANGEYYVAYSYGGSASNIGTSDVQVGSGATSITFTGLEDEPLYWSCIFKSNFSTSSGYQRVIFVRDDGTMIDGMEMDSSAKASSLHWTASYNNGSLTITSSGTNAGGYFHQPGYYQLTYVIGEASPYQKINKTYYASTSAQSEKIEPSTGYDAIGEVNVSIPAVSQTNLIASNIKDGTTVTISNGSTNLWSVTGSYTGSGGGSGVNIATATTTNSNNQNTSVSFTLPSGRTPKAFFCRLTSQIARNSNSRYYYVFDMRWDGSSTGGVAGNTFYMYSGTLTDVTSGYSYSQSGTTFSLSSTGSRSASPGSFYNGTYELVYVY